MTHLSERLHSLPPATFPTLGPDLDNLLSEAGAAEARGVTLPDFVRTLRTRYSAIRETNPSTTNAIQLITAHKAKGSEWQAVLVPFLTRKVQRPNRSYPYLLEIDGPAQPQIVFDKTDADEFRDELELTERQEMERLLYVAFTRAKHTLVLAVDRKFFPKANETIHPHSQFKWLRTDATEPNEKALLGLPSILSTCVETARHQQAQPRLEARESLGLREVGWVDRGRQSADHFVRVVVPSKLTGNDEATAKEEWLEVEPQLRRPRLENPAIRYGIWWHNFAQQVPWADEPRVWEEIFVAAQEHSPDKARSRREWSRLRKRIGRFQDLVGDWSSTSPVIRSELPFFWKMPLDSSLEGVIDLAIIDPETGRWVIIDWKTNHLGPKEIENLRIKYRPQLAAYWQIAREFGACSVQAALFSTATSEFLRYEESELGAEWERLKSLPTQQLMDEFDRP
jgi:ATP-dependent exoDNAse (exonuclease V) beta subunit